MNIYKLSQEENTGYDTYDSLVVIAENEDEARKIHPSEFVTHYNKGHWMGTYRGTTTEYETGDHEWVSFEDIDKIEVEFLGEANENQKKGVVLASFNAG